MAVLTKRRHMVYGVLPTDFVRGAIDRGAVVIHPRNIYLSTGVQRRIHGTPVLSLFPGIITPVRYVDAKQTRR